MTTPLDTLRQVLRAAALRIVDAETADRGDSLELVGQLLYFTPGNGTWTWHLLEKVETQDTIWAARVDLTDAIEALRAVTEVEDLFGRLGVLFDLASD